MIPVQPFHIHRLHIGGIDRFFVDWYKSQRIKTQKLPVIVLPVLFHNKNIFRSDAVAVFDINAGFIGNDHSGLDHGLFHSIRKTPPDILGTLVDIQHIPDPMPGTAFIINAFVPKRLPCQNIQIAPRTPVQESGFRQLQHSNGH